MTARLGTRPGHVAALAAACLGLGACPGSRTSLDRAVQTSEPNPMKPSVDIHLLTTTAQLTMAERASFHVGLEAVNTSPRVVDPNLSSARLLVNDVPSPAWDLALGNGGRSPTWEALPPGEKVSADWPLGEALFPTPGSYRLRLVVGNLETTTVVVVTP